MLRYFSYCYIVLFFILNADLHSQSFGKWQEALIKEFDEGESIWFSYYSGTDVGLNKITLIFGHNQKTIKGILHTSNKNEYFYLESDYKNTAHSYLVMDTLRNVWGSLNCSEKDSVLNGLLINQHKDKAIEFNVLKWTKQMSFTKDCPYHLKYYSYSNDSLGVRLIFQIFQDKNVRGYFSSKVKNNTYYLSGRCNDELCKNIKFQMTDLKTWDKSNIELNITDDKLLIKNNVKFAKQLSRLKKDNSYPFVCKMVQTNVHDIWTGYPSVNNRSYLRWQEDYTDHWVTSHIGPNQHFLDSTSIVQLYFEISNIDPILISGNYYWIEPGFNSIVYYPFNFNLKSGEPIQLIDIFEKNSNYKTVLKNSIDSIRKLLVTGQSRTLQNFLKNDPFNYWNLIPTGICFYSEHHPIFGRYRLLIPYSKVEALIRKSSFIRKYL
ncbi:MAG: hypothetical protein IT267_00640 [Saprospiraceae bacterium]|nr:hypothetical protein [Saprospiraceae bacterium]